MVVLGIESGTSLMLGRHLTAIDCKMCLLLRFGGDGGGGSEGGDGSGGDNHQPWDLRHTRQALCS